MPNGRSEHPGDAEVDEPSHASESQPAALQSANGSTPNKPTFSRTASVVSRISRSFGKKKQTDEWMLFAELMAGTSPSKPSRSNTSRPQIPQYLQTPGPAVIGSPLLPSSSSNYFPESDRDSTRVSTEPISIGVKDDNQLNSHEPGLSNGESSARSLQRPKRVERLSTSRPTPSTTNRKVAKCVLAYFIASLFTFVSPLSNFLTDVTSDSDVPSPSGHLVATIAVYFNPANTAGAMGDADVYCFAGVLYSGFASLTSMSLYWLLESRAGIIADLFAIGWLAVCMGIVAWAKLRMGKPTFNTACSMMAIIIFIVVVKEGGLETLSQVTVIVALGVLISNLVCYLVWPETAIGMLRSDILKTLDAFSTLLDVLTQTFVMEDDIPPEAFKLQQAIEDHQSSFTSLKAHLAQSRSEWVLSGRSTTLRVCNEVVGNLTLLGQHLGGLRNGTKLQEDFIRTYSLARRKFANRNLSQNSGEEALLIQEARMIFSDVVGSLSHPIQALTHACVDAINEVQVNISELNPDSDARFEEAVDSLHRALFSFESTTNQAILRLYHRSDLFPALTAQRTDDESDKEEILFIVYFFVFTLRDFAEDLVPLITKTGQVFRMNERKVRDILWEGLRRPFRADRFVQLGVGRNTTLNKAKPVTTFATFSLKQKARAFPDVRPHAPNTVQTPARSSLSILGKVKQVLWTVAERLREPDKIYAIKAGMATAILAAPAFFEPTRPIFVEYRGEWALISFFVVISPTIGATNLLGVHRIGGTLLGAVTAIALYSLFSRYPLVLAILGALFSAPCFWLIVHKPKYATTGRFILLTYNLTCLYSYNTRHESISVVKIAIHRVTAVLVGVVWALIVSRVLWPSLARKELSKTLSELLANMGWFYTRLVGFYSRPPLALSQAGTIDRRNLSERTPLMPEQAFDQLQTSVKEFQAMELHLQLQLIQAQNLLAQAQHEPRFKGPFPITLYRSILASLQSMLDQLHSMRSVTTRAEWFTGVRGDFILPVNRQRRDLVGNVLLCFSTLSSAFRLKAPLPPYMPPAEASRERLVKAIRNLDIVRQGQVESSQQLLYFAYALTMKSVIKELDFLGSTLQDAFGVVGQTKAEFDQLFEVSDSWERV